MKKLSLLSLFVGGLFSLVAIGAAKPQEINYKDFFEAARLGNVGKVEEMIKAGAQLDYPDKYGSNALHRAADEGRLAVVDLLLNSGAAVDHKDTYGFTALMLAAQNNSAAVVDRLLKSGAAIDHQAHGGDTALMLAAGRGHVEVIKALLLAGANPNIKNRMNKTALDIAKQSGKEKAYLEAVRSVEKMREERKKVVTLFKEREQSPNSPLSKEINYKDFFKAASLGDVGRVKEMIQVGAEVDHKDERGYTALMMASIKGHPEMVRFLIEKGASIDMAGRKGGETALSLAASEGHNKVVDVLLEKGAQVDLRDNDLWTPLIWAVYKGHVNVIKSLLLGGANPDLKNVTGKTALMIASMKGYPEMVRFLIEKGASIDLAGGERGDETALSLAASEGHNKVVDVLLEKGAQVDLRDNDLWTPLMRAAYKGHVNVIKSLLLGGANPDLKNITGKTALDLARQYGKEKEYLEAVSYLDKMTRKKVVTLLLKEREKSPDSPFSKENMPREILEEIMVRSGLIKSGQERRAEQERKQKQ